jgi:2-polyprenyl-3-methyl-5-hydroxy-6-metoxy-1,4-benzoquinol methylase
LDYGEEIAIMNHPKVCSNVSLEQVERFWSAYPCNSDYSNATDRRAYFEEIEKRRYQLIRHIPEVARFSHFSGKKVLEVGCGLGIDGMQFARHGALYTGINLDEGSTMLAREAFSLSGLPGSIRRMNAEQMDFPSATFDHVYSLGVIHHSPNPEKIVKEIFRVLKPGGTTALMVYNKTSINYYFEIMFLRKILRYALRPKSAPRYIGKLLGLEEGKLIRHRDILLTESMTHERWVSINTDGPDCPLARVYSSKQVLRLFSRTGFTAVKTFVRFFDRTHYGFAGKLIAPSVADRIGNSLGWCRWVEGSKPR